MCMIKNIIKYIVVVPTSLLLKTSIVNYNLCNVVCTMTTKSGKDVYAECRHIKRITPEPMVDDELSKQISREYRTLPSFEKTLFDKLYIKHYSLETNELLKCRWRAYRDQIDDRVFAPFQFPDNRDLHFYNGSIRFLPAVSIHRFPEYRMKLKPGPGVDYRGQMPIPQELIMKRGLPVKDKRAKGKDKKNKKDSVVKVEPKKDAEKK